LAKRVSGKDERAAAHHQPAVEFKSLAAVPAKHDLGRESMSSLARVLATLELFTLEKPEWTVEEASQVLGVSVSQTYRYFRILTNAGFLDATTAAGFALGPAFAAYDRQIQLSDPLLLAARPVMQEVVKYGPSSATMFLTRIYHERAMCAERIARGDGVQITYERGRLISLFRGATTRVILANLPPRTIRRLYDAQRAEAAFIGKTWDEFRAALASVRRQGFCVAHSEVDAGLLAVAAPIFGPNRAVLGGLGFIVIDDDSEGLIRRLTSVIIGACAEISSAIGSAAPTPLRQAPAVTPRKPRAAARR
jgi:DNA-binding IclR family transcriptional regulator